MCPGSCGTRLRIDRHNRIVDVRADRQVEASEILGGILEHLASSSRFIADVSGLNVNVMLELGMMIRSSQTHTLILCDHETYKVLPSDLNGRILMVYPEEARRDTESFASWIEDEMGKYPVFFSMKGVERTP